MNISSITTTFGGRGGVSVYDDGWNCIQCLIPITTVPCKKCKKMYYCSSICRERSTHRCGNEKKTTSKNNTRILTLGGGASSTGSGSEMKVVVVVVVVVDMRDNETNLLLGLSKIMGLWTLIKLLRSESDGGSSVLKTILLQQENIRGGGELKVISQ